MSTAMSSKISSRFRNQLPSIWITINKAVSIEKPINLGQGFPNYNPKEHILKHLQDVSRGSYDLHQYTRSYGHPRLVKALSQLYSPSLKRPINAESEILVTIGAYGSLYCAINALLDRGDEAVIVEPFFDCYQPMVESVGAVPRFVTYKTVLRICDAFVESSLKRPALKSNGDGVVHSSELYIDESELRSLINPRTKIIIINTPNNPNGRVMDMKELSMIAKLCQEHDLVCIADEVYEWLVYPPNSHLKIASLPGMWERTVTIGSVGKTLNVTGWKLGWSVGPADLITGMGAVAQNVVYTCPTPLQEAAARSLETEMDLLGSPDSYFAQTVIELVAKRDKMAAEIVKLGMTPTIPDGGYFMLADFTSLISEEFRAEAKSQKLALDVHFNNWMMRNIKVSGIPNSAFYCKEHEHLAENYIRFCFFKTDETLHAAFEAFHKWRKENGDRKI